VFLIAISIHIGLLSTKIHNGDDNPKAWSVVWGLSDMQQC